MSGSTSLVAPPLIEQIRSNHEEIERLEQFVMKELMTEHLSPMKHLFQGHRLRSMTKSILLKTGNLVETYAAAIPAETEPFHGQIALWTNVSYNFYSRLEQIYQYHGDFSSGRPFDADEVLKDEPAIAFCVEVSTDLKEQYADVKVEGWGNHSRDDELFPYHPVWNMQGLLDAGPEQVNEDWSLVVLCGCLLTRCIA